MSIRVPKQKRSMNRKLRIIETAKKLFAQKGMNRTSSNEIAREAGVSIGSFYSYFGNKKSLFLEILKNHLENFITGIYSLQQDETITLKDNIRRHIMNAFSVFDIQSSFHKEALVMKFTDPEVRLLFEDVEKKQLVLITTLLEFYRKGKEPRDLEAVAKVIHSAVENVAHYVKFLEYQKPKDSLINELIEMVYRYVDDI